MLHKLTKIANQLDRKGFYKEASTIDLLLKRAAIGTYTSNLIKALKDIDMEAARQTIVEAIRNLPYGIKLNEIITIDESPELEEGGARPLTDDELRELLEAIKYDDIHMAREIVGMDPVSQTCHLCNGTGYVSESSGYTKGPDDEPCPRCNGKGRIIVME